MKSRMVRAAFIIIIIMPHRLSASRAIGPAYARGLAQGRRAYGKPSAAVVPAGLVLSFGFQRQPIFINGREQDRLSGRVIRHGLRRLAGTNGSLLLLLADLANRVQPATQSRYAWART